MIIKILKMHIKNTLNDHQMHILCLSLIHTDPCRESLVHY